MPTGINAAVRTRLIATDQTGPAFASVNRRVGNLNTRLSRLGSATGGLGFSRGLGFAVGGAGGLLAVTGVASAVGGLVEATQELEQGRNRLRQVITDVQELDRVFLEVARNARDTYSELGTGIDTFARLKRSVESSGLERTNDELLRLQKTILQLAATSGRSNIEITQGLRQLFQGIASNRLSGDELRSVLENISPIADVIAESLGVTRGELRQLGEDGKLTTDVLVNAFERAEGQAEERFGRINVTLQQTAAQFEVNKDLYLATLDEQIGVTETFQRALEKINELLTRRNELDAAGRRREARADEARLIRLRRLGIDEESRPVPGFLDPGLRPAELERLYKEMFRVADISNDVNRSETERTAAAETYASLIARINELKKQENTLAEYNLRLADDGVDAARKQYDEAKRLVDYYERFTSKDNLRLPGARNALTLAEERLSEAIAAANALRGLGAVVPTTSLADFDPKRNPLLDDEYLKKLLARFAEYREELDKVNELLEAVSKEEGLFGENEEGIVRNLKERKEALEIILGIIDKINKGRQRTFDIERAIARLNSRVARITGSPFAEADALAQQRDAELQRARDAGKSADQIDRLAASWNRLIRLVETADLRAATQQLQDLKESLETDLRGQNTELNLQIGLVSRRITDEEYLLGQLALQLGSERNITEEMRKRVAEQVKLTRQLEEAQRIRSLQEQVVSGITGSFYDAFQQLLDGSAKDLFRNFFEGVARSFTDAIIQDWSDRLGDYLFDIFFGGPGGGGSGFFSRLFTGRQYGGPVSAGRGYTINEGFGQREIFFPGTDGYIHPNTGGLGGATYITASTTVNGSVRSDDDLRQISEQQEIVASNVLNKAMQQWKYRRFPNQIGT